MQLEKLRSLESPTPRQVSMFLRAAAPFSPAQVEELKSDGATIRVQAGPVLTIDAPLEAVERILDHDFVVQSELSAPLYQENSAEPPSDAE